MGRLLVHKNRILAGSSSTSDWTRPTDWLAMPTIGTQEFIGLLAITDDDSNYIALLCTGAYTVDWGDGVIENVVTNTKAQHTYTYSAISNSTISSRGYKQVLVRVTPQDGQNLTKLSLQQQHSAVARVQSVGWLDIAINGPSMSLIYLGGLSIWASICENVDIYSLANPTSLAELFNNFASLQKFTIANTSLVSNTQNMFDGCRALRTVPLFDMASVTNATSMFYNCTSLLTIPLFNTSKLIGAQQMFTNCNSLRTIPLLDFSNVTNLIYTFQGCFSLQSVPLLNTVKVTNATQAFYQCLSLQTIPNFNFTASIGLDSILASTSVGKGAFQNVKVNSQYTNLFYNRAAVIEVFNGLASGVTSKTITITTNPAFNSIPLNVTAGTYRGITVQNTTQDVYVSNATTGLIYKQTGGVGSFVAESLASNTSYRGMGTDVYDSVYLINSTSSSILRKLSGSTSWTSVTISGVSGNSSAVAGDSLGNLYVGTSFSGALYKQTALTGAFVQVFTGVVTTIAISPIDNSIYVSDGGATGTIYKQTGGSGSFNAVQSIPYSTLWCTPSGDVYAGSTSTLYKQTGGIGSFVSMGISSPALYGGVVKADGTMYSINADVYLIDFNKVITPTDRLIETNKGWTIA